MTDTTAPGTPTPTTPAPKKKRSVGGLILRLFGVLVLLFVLTLAGLYFFRNTLVRAGVVRGGYYATDQTTALEAADLAIFGGTLDLSTLKIANPAKSGYKEPNFLSMKSCNVNVDSGTFLSNKIVVKEIKIDGLEIFLEQNGAKNNLAEIMDIIKAKTSAASPAAGSSTAPQSPGRSLAITHLSLKNTKVHLRGILSMDLNLGDIQIDDPTNPDGRPMKIADVIAKVLLNVAQQIVNNPQLPADFKNGLKDVTKLVDDLKGNLNKGLKDVSKNFENLGKDGGKGLQDAAKGLENMGKDGGKGLQEMGKGLQNLIPGQKPATKP
jgi:hypothetical protein